MFFIVLDRFLRVFGRFWNVSDFGFDFRKQMRVQVLSCGLTKMDSETIVSEYEKAVPEKPPFWILKRPWIPNRYENEQVQ